MITYDKDDSDDIVLYEDGMVSIVRYDRLCSSIRQLILKLTTSFIQDMKKLCYTYYLERDFLLLLSSSSSSSVLSLNTNLR